LDILDEIVVDWDNFQEAGALTREFARQLGCDRARLRALVMNARTDPTLRYLAEKHHELQYIVLHDALDRGLRVRLHRFACGLEDVPHNHRFSFSSFILAGSYVHTLYELQCEPKEGSRELWRLEQPPGTTSADRPQVSVFGLTTAMINPQVAGSAYSLHHGTVHKTAMPHSDAFSIFIRGPAQKSCALQLDPPSRTYRWKFGRDHETAQALAERAMSDKEFDVFIAALEAAQII
jgi:hypothetical protein